MKRVQTIDTEQEEKEGERRLSDRRRQSEEDRPYREVHKEKRQEEPDRKKPEEGQALRPIRL